MALTSTTPISTHHPREEDLPPAHSLREAADSDNTLQGYVAMNQVDPESEIGHYAAQHPVNLHQQIAELAYHLYLERGGEHGHADEDWLKAERIVTERLKVEH